MATAWRVTRIANRDKLPSRGRQLVLLWMIAAMSPTIGISFWGPAGLTRLVGEVGIFFAEGLQHQRAEGLVLSLQKLDLLRVEFDAFYNFGGHVNLL